MPFSDKVRSMLERPNPAVITTLRPDGQPVSVATWYDLDGDRLFVNMDITRKRVEHLRNDPRVSLAVLNGDSWYQQVTIVGRVVQMGDDEGLAGIDRLSKRYNGRRYPNRTSPRVNAWIEVTSWSGWGVR
jgi:PPOX class probable F420-dependent enzyme